MFVAFGVFVFSGFGSLNARALEAVAQPIGPHLESELAIRANATILSLMSVGFGIVFIPQLLALGGRGAWTQAVIGLRVLAATLRGVSPRTGGLEAAPGADRFHPYAIVNVFLPLCLAIWGWTLSYLGAELCAVTTTPGPVCLDLDHSHLRPHPAANAAADLCLIAFVGYAGWSLLSMRARIHRLLPVTNERGRNRPAEFLERHPRLIWAVIGTTCAWTLFVIALYIKLVSTPTDVLLPEGFWKVDLKGMDRFDGVDYLLRWGGVGAAFATFGTALYRELTKRSYDRPSLVIAGTFVLYGVVHVALACWVFWTATVSGPDPEGMATLSRVFTTVRWPMVILKLPLLGAAVAFQFMIEMIRAVRDLEVLANEAEMTRLRGNFHPLDRTNLPAPGLVLPTSDRVRLPLDGRVEAWLDASFWAEPGGFPALLVTGSPRTGKTGSVTAVLRRRADYLHGADADAGVLVGWGSDTGGGFRAVDTLLTRLAGRFCVDWEPFRESLLNSIVRRIEGDRDVARWGVVIAIDEFQNLALAEDGAVALLGMVLQRLRKVARVRLVAVSVQLEPADVAAIANRLGVGPLDLDHLVAGWPNEETARRLLAWPRRDGVRVVASAEAIDALLQAPNLMVAHEWVMELAYKARSGEAGRLGAEVSSEVSVALFGRLSGAQAGGE